DRIWRFHHVPWSMPVIGHGKALAFPYALVPWLSAALLRPVLCDWAGALWLGVGTVRLIAATFWAFPELRRGWWAAAVLVNPALVVAAIIGQLPFLGGGSVRVGGRGALEPARGGRGDHRPAPVPVGCLDADGRGGVLAATAIRRGRGAGRARAGDASGGRPTDGRRSRRLVVVLGAGPSKAAALLRRFAAPRHSCGADRLRFAGARRH